MHGAGGERSSTLPRNPRGVGMVDVFGGRERGERPAPDGIAQPNPEAARGRPGRIAVPYQSPLVRDRVRLGMLRPKPNGWDDE